MHPTWRNKSTYSFQVIENGETKNIGTWWFEPDQHKSFGDNQSSPRPTADQHKSFGDNQSSPRPTRHRQSVKNSDPSI